MTSPISYVFLGVASLSVVVLRPWTPAWRPIRPIPDRASPLSLNSIARFVTWRGSDGARLIPVSGSPDEGTMW